VLILLPASETKAATTGNRPLDPDGLSFPPLASTRAAVLDALVDVSARPDATRRLGVPAGRADSVRGNVDLLDAGTQHAGSLYAGPLYEGLGLADLDPASRRRAHAWIVVISALWGAVRLGDRIPPYRLNMCGRLPGLAHLPQVWQTPLAEVLPAAAGRGVIVDGRVAGYATAWRPAGTLAERTVVLRVVRDLEGGRGAASHGAKRTRGLVARRIVTGAIDPPRPDELARALAPDFELDLREPARSRRPWELRVVDPQA
jgi:cytoplasmic iron level regulating protein YaaA (DUF328/UPF0246 family)